MPYDQEVKDRAYTLDPECWKSYSGQPRRVKQHMDMRRTAALHQAQVQLDATKLTCSFTVTVTGKSQYEISEMARQLRDDVATDHDDHTDGSTTLTVTELSWN